MVTQKQCIGCLETKEITHFTKQKNNADGTGFRSYCRDCYKKMRRKYYEKDPATHIARSRKTNKRLTKEFKTLKKQFKCGECGEKDHRCLDFHHIDPTQKIKSVRNMFFRHGKEKAAQEIEKCTILCANCHRKHHLELYITKQDIADRYPMIGEGI